MLFSIIIPYHTETSEQIKPLMRSINEQVGIKFDDLEILMCNDMKDEITPLDTYTFNEYENLRGRIIKLKSPYKCNPGMSRQLGINNAKGEYLIFCDADDSLFHYCALRAAADNINQSHADVYRFKFMEEIGSFETDDLWYSSKNQNWVWMFAKVYKKQFLLENNITFESRNRWHEDTYFNLLTKYCEPKTVDIDSMFYLWRFSRTSVTRVGNHEYTFNTIDEYLQSTSYAFEKITKEYKKNCLDSILCVVYNYYNTLMDPANKGKAKYEEIEKAYYNFVKRLVPNLFNSIPPQVQTFFAKLATGDSQTFLPEKSLKDFLTYLKEKYKNE